MAVLRSVQHEDRGASHHCWAYLLTDGRSRCSDDGEPGGSAGRPILAQIGGHDLVNVMVVVSRWFGGTKLGVGGLMRAYGGCAGKLLDRGEILDVVATVDVVVVHQWSDTAAVQAVIAREGLQVGATRYDTAVQLTLVVPVGSEEAVKARLRDATAGRAQIQESS